MAKDFNEWLEKLKKSDYNIQMILERYPWLGLRDKPIEEQTWTYLDNIPDGWYNAFGFQMCEEINDALMKLWPAARKDFTIIDIKEKYGALRVYTNWATEPINNIINKYKDISARTCVVCGKPATMITTNWILPFCAEHGSEYPDAIPINKFIVKAIKEV